MAGPLFFTRLYLWYNQPMPRVGLDEYECNDVGHGYRAGPFFCPDAGHLLQWGLLFLCLARRPSGAPFYKNALNKEKTTGATAIDRPAPFFCPDAGHLLQFIGFIAYKKYVKLVKKGDTLVSIAPLFFALGLGLI